MKNAPLEDADFIWIVRERDCAFPDGPVAISKRESSTMAWRGGVFMRGGNWDAIVSMGRAERNHQIAINPKIGLNSTLNKPGFCTVFSRDNFE